MLPAPWRCPATLPQRPPSFCSLNLRPSRRNRTRLHTAHRCKSYQDNILPAPYTHLQPQSSNRAIEYSGSPYPPPVGYSSRPSSLSIRQDSGMMYQRAVIAHGPFDHHPDHRNPYPNQPHARLPSVAQILDSIDRDPISPLEAPRLSYQSGANGAASGPIAPRRGQQPKPPGHSQQPTHSILPRYGQEPLEEHILQKADKVRKRKKEANRKYRAKQRQWTLERLQCFERQNQELIAAVDHYRDDRNRLRDIVQATPVISTYAVGPPSPRQAGNTANRRHLRQARLEQIQCLELQNQELMAAVSHYRDDRNRLRDIVRATRGTTKGAGV